MSALPPKADIPRRRPNVRFGPDLDEQCRRKLYPKCLRSLEVDYQVEFRGLVDRHIGGLLPLQDTAGVVANVVVRLGKWWSVTHQPANSREFAPVV
jgi:hypothetical protein